MPSYTLTHIYYRRAIVRPETDGGGRQETDAGGGGVRGASAA